jgi:hypothetical protein
MVAIVSTAAIRIAPEEADELIALYCDWREECALAERAYEWFSSSAGPDRALAFAAYTAALDREESAASMYAARIGAITSRHM